MKKIKLNIILIILGLSLFSCQDELLDKQPKDKILETQVWNDVNLLEAYVKNLYSRMQLPYSYIVDPRFGEIMFAEAITSDEVITPHTWHGTYARLFGIINTQYGSYMDYWDYAIIRDMNTFIENSENITTSVISDAVKKQRIAEVRFLRAYTYFELVKRYGGVPLITKVQSLDMTDEELFVKRDKEQVIYDFIASELDAIVNDLPTELNSQRFTKWAALALKARAMLYAGSIAKYGQVELNGLIGIPASEANKYFQSSYDASKALIPASEGGGNSSNTFALYRSDIKTGDLTSYTQNYYNLFLKKSTTESIFEKNYISQDLGNSLNYWENNLYLSLVMYNQYETVDGSPAASIVNGATVENQSALWMKKEPRFHATWRWDQQPWFPGDTMYTHNYLYTKTGSKDNSPSNVFTKGNGQKIRGQGNYGGAAFWRRKMSAPVRETNWALSAHPAILFRLGETYLNFAEAALELNITNDALLFTNKIRERAGLTPHSSIDMEKIRHERMIELMLEGHRFWDMKRWRIAHKSMEEGGLNGTPKRIEVYYDLRDDKYHFITTNNVYPNPVVFKSAYYYMPIRLDRTTNNPNLVENPGYN